MNVRLRITSFCGGLAALMGAAIAHAETVHARLISYEEVPAVSSVGSGNFRASIDETAGALHWTLSYEAMEADVTQSHLHLGQASVNGGVFVFLCSNLGNGPAGTQACPARAGELSGVIMAGDMVAGATAQGLSPGEFAELVEALRSGVVYANVHTTARPGGEIRGQIKGNEGRN
ncbi:MAG TPA: CHRD domain-containing protein [Steroidobacteraceae bacterium]|nr:CHRD domain-containing protein [Steroidobacteraceae bacterium]